MALDVATSAVLAVQRDLAAQRCEVVGVILEPDPFVWSQAPDYSEPLRPGRVTSLFADLRDELGMQGVRFHHLRHFAATVMLAGGVDVRTVAGRLGHSRDIARGQACGLSHPRCSPVDVQRYVHTAGQRVATGRSSMRRQLTAEPDSRRKRTSSNGLGTASATVCIHLQPRSGTSVEITGGRPEPLVTWDIHLQLHVVHVLGHQSEPLSVHVESAQETTTAVGGVHSGCSTELSVLPRPHGCGAHYRVPDGGRGNVDHDIDHTQRAPTATMVQGLRQVAH